MALKNFFTKPFHLHFFKFEGIILLFTNMSIFLDFIFPNRCYICGAKGDCLCASCLERLPIHPFKDNRLSLFFYQGAIKEIIKDIKFNGVTNLVSQISQISCNLIKKHYPHLLKYWQKHKFVITSVPLHHYRFLFRGFNQSQLLAKSIANNLNLQYSDVFIKTKYTQSQVSLKKKIRRLSNLTHTFKILSPPPKNLIIFDDVYTTGSTLRSLKKLLSKNQEIFFLTLAS